MILLTVESLLFLYFSCLSSLDKQSPVLPEQEGYIL